MNNLVRDVDDGVQQKKYFLIAIGIISLLLLIRYYISI